MADAKFQFNTLWNKFDTVYVHETEGRHDLKSLRHFLEERAKIEEAYAQALIKLQAKEKDFEAKGSHAKCWTDLKNVSKSLAEQHLALAAVFNKDIGSTLDAAVKKMKLEKEKLMAEHKNLEKELAKKQSNHDKAQARYKEAVKAAETAVINRDGGLKEHLPPPKQAALESKVTVSLEKVEKSHNEYQAAVNELQGMQNQWDDALRKHLDAFEMMERERLSCLTDQFRKACDAHVELRKVTEQLSLLLSGGVAEITSEADMHAFVSANIPDTQPPAHVVYEPVVSEILNHARGGGGLSAFMPRKETADAPSAPMVGAVGAMGAMGAAKGKPPPPSVGPSSVDTKASIQNAIQKKNEKMVVALYDFESEEAADLHFKVGDHIKVIDNSDPHWWRGELNGKEGTFPSNYVEERGGAGDEPAANGSAENPKVMDARAEALYDFVAQGADELSFRAGEILHVTGELNQWYLGKSADGSRAGIFPSNYVTLL